MSNGWRTSIGLAAAVTVVALGLSGVHALSTSGHRSVSLVTERSEAQRSESPEGVATPTAGATPQSQTFQLTGGTVTLSCSSGVISVDVVTPNAGFTVERELKEEAAQVEIRFESATHESRLEASCVGNQIQVDELREEPVEQPAPPAPPTAPRSTTRTFSLVGGTVSVTCTGNAITINSATPNPGFSVEQELKDDGNAVEFRFESNSHESRLEVSCVGGRVQVEELREESS